MDIISLSNEDIAQALEKCDWSGVPIGNKVILAHAVSRLRVNGLENEALSPEELRAYIARTMPAISAGTGVPLRHLPAAAFYPWIDTPDHINYVTTDPDGTVCGWVNKPVWIEKKCEMPQWVHEDESDFVIFHGFTPHPHPVVSIEGRPGTRHHAEAGKVEGQPTDKFFPEPTTTTQDEDKSGFDNHPDVVKLPDKPSQGPSEMEKFYDGIASIYNWDRAPVWANFAASDAEFDNDGRSCFWFEKKPSFYQNSDTWEVKRPGSSAVTRIDMSNQDVEKLADISSESSLERRPDSAPVLFDWSKAPEWAQFAAVDCYEDEGRSAHWFSHKPQFSGSEWLIPAYFSNESKVECGVNEVNEKLLMTCHPRNSRQERPKSDGK